MARIDIGTAERPLPQHKRGSQDWGATRGDDDEKRMAVPVGDDELGGDDWRVVEDDKSVVVLSMDELLPFDDDDGGEHHDARCKERLVRAIQDMREQEDWLVQHEATVVLRRIVVRHTHVIEAPHIDAFLGRLVLGCDNLRSALSKNSLLALAECFEFLGATQADKFLSQGAVLETLLRRSACEKKFLRDAAAFAVQQMVAYLASWQLVSSAGAFASTKSGRLCGNAARVVSSSLLRLQARKDGSITRLCEVEDGKPMRTVCHALAVFHGAKDKRARLEAAAAFKVLGEELGEERFEAAVKRALKDPLAAARIAKDVFPPPAAAGANKARRGSLRERILLDAAT
ncbi:hypothetical protein PybrP1_002024 [[Pythium] brassicae (nom. inval.)]|nr:hypothetical protein PybrP1_002024 [[Pythium] brassicae (nom. inval.)]